MGLFKSIFKGEDDDNSSQSKKNSSSAVLTVNEIQRLTKDAVKIIFDVPKENKEDFLYQPGQYLNLIVPLNEKKEHRSYSICSDIKEPLAIGVKKVEDGYVSAYLNDSLRKGDQLEVEYPMGKFIVPDSHQNIVGFTGGSGITPLLSIAKNVENNKNTTLTLFYGNRGEESVMFSDEIDALLTEKITVQHIFSEQKKDGVNFGLLTEAKVTELVKENLSLLKADGFYICGPEQMILNVQSVLKQFGVPENKIYFELFTTPTQMESPSTSVPEEEFDGLAQVTIILDEEEEEFELTSDGDTILDEAESHGLEPPYSCRGAICCTCRAKVLEGSAKMDNNFTLTDEEVEEGYILTCQAHPTSKKLVVSYDD